VHDGVAPGADRDAGVDDAAAAGARYLVLTAEHHEGSACGRRGWTAPVRGRDLARELVAREFGGHELGGRELGARDSAATSSALHGERHAAGHAGGDRALTSAPAARPVTAVGRGLDPECAPSAIMKT
jgi:hypothetical protein